MEFLYTVEPLKGKQNSTTLWGQSWLVKSLRQKLVVCRAPWISQGKSIGLSIIFVSTQLPGSPVHGKGYMYAWTTPS